MTTEINLRTETLEEVNESLEKAKELLKKAFVDAAEKEADNENGHYTRPNGKRVWGEIKIEIKEMDNRHKIWQVE